MCSSKQICKISFLYRPCQKSQMLARSRVYTVEGCIKSLYHGFPPAREILHPLKLADYLIVQADKPWYNFNLGRTVLRYIGTSPCFPPFLQRETTSWFPVCFLGQYISSKEGLLLEERAPSRLTTSKWRRNDVDATSSCRVDVISTSSACWACSYQVF